MAGNESQLDPRALTVRKFYGQVMFNTQLNEQSKVGWPKNTRFQDFPRTMEELRTALLTEPLDPGDGDVVPPPAPPIGGQDFISIAAGGMYPSGPEKIVVPGVAGPSDGIPLFFSEAMFPDSLPFRQILPQNSIAKFRLCMQVAALALIVDLVDIDMLNPRQMPVIIARRVYNTEEAGLEQCITGLIRIPEEYALDPPHILGLRLRFGSNAFGAPLANSRFICDRGTDKIHLVVTVKA